MGAVSINNVRKSYGSMEVLHGVSVDIADGEFVILVGPSGCGKSTLLELVCGLREPLEGTIEAGGERRAPERLRRCAYMPQRDLLLPWLSALDNAALALRNRGAGRARARREAGELFERFGLTGFERTPPAQLSGGMRQRVAFLRTLVAGKPVLLLDEPFASLDAITRGEMQQWLAGALEVDPRSVVLVSHDIEEALYLSDRVAVLSPRPGRVLATLRAPAPRAPDRDAAVTDPEFVAARQRAMTALRAGARSAPAPAGAPAAVGAGSCLPS
jgi:NitT/TauT family transport system ATP-binding protein